MNVWKTITLGASAALVVSFGVGIGVRAAAADGPCHNQGNMANALSSLNTAKGYLGKAEHNKGGWRVNALEATNKAIAETNRGCAFADTH